MERLPPVLRLLRPLLALLLGVCLTVLPGAWTLARSSPLPASSALDRQARQAYQSGRYATAEDLWRRAAAAFRQDGDLLSEAMALSNLALSLRRLGQPTAAQQAIEASLTLLRGPAAPPGPRQLRALAQAIHTQARLHDDQGQTLQALRGWRQAADLQRQSGDASAAVATTINQAQALQALGQLRDARELLEPLVASLRAQPASSPRAAALLTLGDILLRQGDPSAALAPQKESLATAEALGSPAAISAAALAIADSQQALGHTAAALRSLRQAQAASEDPLDRLQAGASALSVLVDSFQYAAAARLWPGLLALANEAPASRRGLDASLHLASTLLRLRPVGPALPPSQVPPAAAIRALLRRCQDTAEQLGDPRALSISAGSLGRLEESEGAWAEAERHSQQALRLALPLESAELNSRWFWQLGRLARQRGDLEAARQNYEQAITAQQTLRQDLAATSSRQQSAFRREVEPLYRQYVDLLTSGPGQPAAAALQRSREVIESLQIAEINDFFREACLQPSRVPIDQIDAKAAVVYPIVLPDRLEVIVRLPGANGALIAHSQPLADGALERTVDDLERVLYRDPIERARFDSTALLPSAQRLYDWMLKPLEGQLASSGALRLVFVPDSALRNVPMAVLHDGQGYLGQRYGVALAPGLQLRLSPGQRAGHQRLLLAGVSEERDGFPALASVPTELDALRRRWPATQLLNAGFTRDALRRALASGSYSVVHLATHGQFSSNAADTFVLAWDQRIPVGDLDALLQPGRRRGGDSLDLLVLSACQTAAGDAAANLGLAAMAVRSGASSTLASLWPVSDAATSQFMKAFYGAWDGGRVSKIEALRQAQQQMLASPETRHPFFWAAFTLLGNWS